MQTTTASQLYNALSRLSRQVLRMEHRMARCDMRGWQRMHRGQAHLLSIISRKNGASQRDLAEEMDVRPSSMTEALLKMEAAGLITRKQDENDQRIMRIFLAEAGEKAVRQSNVAALDLTTGLFNGLTSEEQVQLLSLIEKLSASLESMDRPGMFGEHGHEFREKHHRHRGSGCPNSIPFYPKNRNPDDDY